MNEMDMIEILLVEDSLEDVEITLRAFKKQNLANKVHVVEDGEEALDYIFAKGKYKDRDFNIKPKVILLDLKLPKVSGLEVLREIRADDRTKLLPVVVLTSSQEEKDIAASYRLGVNSYITKPVDFKKFLDTVSELGMYWLLLNKPPV